MNSNERPGLVKACQEITKIFSEPWHGENLANNQVRKAARIAIELVGVDWIILQDKNKNSKSNHFLAKQQLKVAVKLPLSKWHSDPARVWRSFEKHALEIASGREARKIIKTYRIG